VKISFSLEVITYPLPITVTVEPTTMIYILSPIVQSRNGTCLWFSGAVKESDRVRPKYRTISLFVLLSSFGQNRSRGTNEVFFISVWKEFCFSSYSSVMEAQRIEQFWEKYFADPS
jgi:hypothetical protein